MYRLFGVSAIALMLAGPAMAGHGVSQYEKVAITTEVASIGCVGDSRDIERRVYRDGGYIYRFDDVTCADGRTYKIMLDWQYRVIELRRD